MTKLFIKSIFAPALFITSVYATDIQEKITPVPVDPAIQANFNKGLEFGLRYAKDRFPWAYSDERVYQLWHYSSRKAPCDPRELISTLQAVQKLDMTQLMERLQLLADTSDKPLNLQEFEIIGFNLSLIDGITIETLKMLSDQFMQIYGSKTSIARIVYTNFNIDEDPIDTDPDYISGLLTLHRWFASKGLNPIRDWRLVDHEFISDIMAYSDETREELYQRIQFLELGVPIKYGSVFSRLYNLVSKYPNEHLQKLKVAMHKLVNLRLLSTATYDNSPEELLHIINFLNYHPNPLDLELDNLIQAYREDQNSGGPLLLIFLKS